jgi:hypothetical protein
MRGHEDALFIGVPPFKETAVLTPMAREFFLEFSAPDTTRMRTILQAEPLF